MSRPVKLPYKELRFDNFRVLEKTVDQKTIDMMKTEYGVISIATTDHTEMYTAEDKKRKKRSYKLVTLSSKTKDKAEKAYDTLKIIRKKTDEMEMSTAHALLKESTTDLLQKEQFYIDPEKAKLIGKLINPELSSLRIKNMGGRTKIKKEEKALLQKLETLNKKFEVHPDKPLLAIDKAIEFLNQKSTDPKYLQIVQPVLLNIANYQHEMQAKQDVQDKKILSSFSADEKIRFVEPVKGKIESKRDPLTKDEMDILTRNVLKKVYKAHLSSIEKAKIITPKTLVVENKSDVAFVPEWQKLTVTTPEKTVFPNNERQAEYITAIRDNDVVVSEGPAGTGKTYVAAAVLVDMLEDKDHPMKKIIVTRPVVEVGQAMGFLPGDAKEKIDPYLRPIYDAFEELLGVEKTRKYIESKKIEIAPLAYMRGRTLKNCGILFDEVQNATIEEMDMFLTRLGENVKAVVDGDKTQTDLKERKANISQKRAYTGLDYALELLDGVQGIAMVHFERKHVTRSALLGRIIKAKEQRFGENGLDIVDGRPRLVGSEPSPALQVETSPVKQNGRTITQIDLDEDDPNHPKWAEWNKMRDAQWSDTPVVNGKSRNDIQRPN